MGQSQPCLRPWFLDLLQDKAWCVIVQGWVVGLIVSRGTCVQVHKTAAKSVVGLRGCTENDKGPRPWGPHCLLLHSLVVTCCASLCPMFLVCKMGIVIVPPSELKYRKHLKV